MILFEKERTLFQECPYFIFFIFFIFGSVVPGKLESFRKLKALLGFFLSVFISITCLKKPVLSKRDLLQWKVPARLYWDLLTSKRYQSACHYF
jgi:hypothetical protein